MLLKSWLWRPACHGTISICMIMKNEERLLSRCLESVRGLADEIIIVDTGSVDRSVEIAKSYGARVLRDPWQDDFARPRNIGLSLAKMDWIFVIDPDEVIAKRDHAKIRELTNRHGVACFQFDTRNYTQSSIQQGFIPNPGDYEEGKGWAGWAPSVKGRLFRSHLGLKFVGRWHELIDYSVVRAGYISSKTDIPVHHYAGEICQSNVKEKQEFYLRIAEKKVQDDPSNDQAWWELGVSEGISGCHKRAVRSICMSMRGGYYTPDRLFQLVFNLTRIGETNKARFVFEKAVCKLFPSLTHVDEGLRNFNALSPHLHKK